MTRARDAGFTLIEVLVSLALFAMIAGVGLSVLDQIVRAQSQTDGRLDRLAGLQRMMHLVVRDLSGSTPGLVLGDGATVALGLQAEAQGVTVTYAVTEGRLMRTVEQRRGGTATQALLSDVTAMRLQYLDGVGAWQDAWPGALDPSKADLRAVEMVVALAPSQGEVRRIVAVPRAVIP